MYDERVAPLPLLELVRRSITLRVAFVVPVPPVRRRLHEHRSVPSAHAIDDVTHHSCGRDDVVPVDGDIADAVPGRAPLEWRSMLRRHRRELGVPVVLAEEDDGEMPDGGEVHRLV